MENAQTAENDFQISSLKNKNFIVTGSTQGLGESIARFLTNQGVNGLILCGRNEDRGTMLAKELTESGTKTHFIRADFERVSDCKNVVAHARNHFDRIDGLVNAAGVTYRGTIEETSPELFDQIMNINFRAPFFLIQETIKWMQENKNPGSIVNIQSISAHGGQPFIAAYCASKGALSTLTKNVAHSQRSHKIRVNGLNIGWMNTPNEHKVQQAMGKPKNWLENASKSLPFGRILETNDVAQLTGFLLSDEGEMMTGSVIDFDQNVMGAFD